VKSTHVLRDVPGVHLEELLIAVFLSGLLLLAYANNTPILEAIEKSRLTFLTALTLPFAVMLAIATGGMARVSNVLRDWWQIIGTLAVYESLKHLHANRITLWLGIPPFDQQMIAADNWIFGKVLPLLLEPVATDEIVDVMWFFYIWGYYLGPAAFLYWAYFVRRDDQLFLRLRKGLVLGLLGGYLIYLVVPVAGPLFVIGEQFNSPIATQPYIARHVFDELRYNWDCFPSLHTAIPWVMVSLAWSRLAVTWRLAAFILATGITLSTVLLRFHYGIDVLAGLAWAALVVVAVDRSRWLMSPVRLPFDFRRIARYQRFDPPHLLGVFFILTGMSALLAEQAFEKLLTTLLGSSTPAAAVVLAVYFLGLSVGAAVYSHFAPRVKNAAVVFALLEGCVALWAIGMYLGFDAMHSVLHPFLSFGRDSPSLLAVLRFAVALVWILPPTLCMGASFPAVVDAISSLNLPDSRRWVSRVYTLNLLGALGGALFGPTIAFPRWGIDGTMLFAALLDGLVCLAALGLTSRSISAHHPVHGAVSAGAPTAIVSRPLRFLCAVAFASGLVFFSLEVVWAHLLAAVLGNSVFVFAAMLALVLLGLLLGSCVSTIMFPGRNTVASGYVGGVFVVAAILIGIQHLCWPDLPSRFSDEAPMIETFLEGEILRWLLAAQQILPTSIVMGMAYPLLFRLSEFPLAQQGRSAGWLAMSNTIGCVLGALSTGFLLIPMFGSERTLVLMAVLALVCSCAVALFSESRSVRWLFFIASISIVAGFLQALPAWDRLALTSGEHVYFRRNQVWPESRLEMFHEDTHGGMTTVVSNPAGVRGQKTGYLTLLTNGKFQGNDSWEMEAQTGFSLVPALLSDNFDHACVIGFGTGRSALVTQAMGFKRIDIAELSPGIVVAGRRHFTHINGGVLDAPGVRLWLEDGRNLLLLNREWRCDMITMEITSIWFAEATSLYSKEFYALAKERLRPGGIFQQWIQLHHITSQELGSVLATAQQVFPYVGLWVLGGQAVVVASERPLRYTAEGARRYLCGARGLGFDEAQAKDMAAKVRGGAILLPEDTRKLVRSQPYVINTDRNRYLEYATPRYNFSNDDFRRDNMGWLRKYAQRTAPLPEEVGARDIKCDRDDPTY
jgi:spermidine synthase